MDVAADRHGAFLGDKVSVRSDEMAGRDTYDGLYVGFILEDLARLGREICQYAGRDPGTRPSARHSLGGGGRQRASSPRRRRRRGRRRSSFRIVERGVETYLLAESLNIDLGQLLAGHQALNPAVQGRDAGRLERGWCQICGGSPNVLHVRIHCCERSGSNVASGVERG